MILGQQKNDVNISGNFKTSSFKIQTNAKAFEILSSNIYTHKVRAVVREISCNARDSHVAAGNIQPFSVHLPTTLEPWFSVRDYGTGLSDSDVREIFSTYFCSTKTSSNDFIGALGLGSKSPFCIVDSFTVISFFDGKKNTYSCYKDESGEPQVALLTSENSNEHNGISVTISVSENLIRQFDEEAVYVYSYFDEMPQINKSSVMDAVKAKKDAYIFKHDDFAFTGKYGNTMAVMGGVAYAIPSQYDLFRCDGYIKFNMGEIAFDAGRESLSLDQKTIDAIQNKTKSIKDSVLKLISDDIEKEPTHFKKLVKAREMMKLNFVDTSSLYKKYPNPICQDIECWSRSYRSTEKSLKEQLPIGDHVSYYKHKPRFASRIKDYIKDFNNHTMVLLTDEQILKTKIDEDVLLDLDTLPKLSRNTFTNNNSHIKVVKFKSDHRYYYSNVDKWEPISIPNDTEEKIYVEISRWDVLGSSFGQMVEAIQFCSAYLKQNISIYGIKTAFLKTQEFKNGNWITLENYMRRELTKKYANKTFTDTNIAWNEEKMLRFLFNNFPQIPNLKKIEAALSPNAKELAERAMCEEYCVNINKDTSFAGLVQKIREKYPMLELVHNFPCPTNSPTAFNIIKQYINGVDENEKKISN